jgi:hypothetical protein
MKYLLITLIAFNTFAAKQIKWDVLKGHDDKKKKTSKEVKSLLKEKTIKIAGFMVPLDYDKEKIKEFLLIPNPMSCMHVPPPPPNQMILVKMPKGKGAKYFWGPVWAEGKLSLNTKSDGQSPGYEMSGKAVSEYKSTLVDHKKKTDKKEVKKDKK